MMDISLIINDATCTRCGNCVAICPAKILSSSTDDGAVEINNLERCIACGHCAAACPTSAVEHSLFPPDKVHRIDFQQMPTPDQMMLLVKARRSNRAFSDKPIPTASLDAIVEAANRAPTATNAQQVGFTLITDPAVLQQLVDYTIDGVAKMVAKLKNPLLRPLLKLTMPSALQYLPKLEAVIKAYRSGKDPILCRATAVLLIHTPKSSALGYVDSQLAYQNGSLMAQCMGVSQFYTGFMLMVIKRDKGNKLAAMLGIDGRIDAGMTLAMPALGTPNYIDRKSPSLTKL